MDPIRLDMKAQHGILGELAPPLYLLCAQHNLVQRKEQRPMSCDSPFPCDRQRLVCTLPSSFNDDREMTLGSGERVSVAIQQSEDEWPEGSLYIDDISRPCDCGRRILHIGNVSWPCSGFETGIRVVIASMARHF